MLGASPFLGLTILFQCVGACATTAGLMLLVLEYGRGARSDAGIGDSGRTGRRLPRTVSVCRGA